MNFPLSMTLGDARDKLRHLVENGGHSCPCCAQFAKVYKRPINSSMARDLIAMYRLHGLEFCYLPDVRTATKSRGNREESKLRYWGLIEEEQTLRPDGGRAGWWRVTELGERFVLNQTHVQKYAHIYDGRRLRFSGSPVSIVEALGQKFNYRELMSR